MARKTLSERRADALSELETAKARLAKLDNEAAERIGRIAIKSGLVNLELTDEQVRKIYPSAAALTVRAENAPRSIDDLLGRLAQTRRLGWSEAIDEAVADVGSVSVAV